MEITPEASFETLKKNVIDEISTFFPYDKGHRNRIVLDKIEVNDSLGIDDIKSQADAKDQERTWGVPVVAHLSLIDKQTGKVIEKRKTTLATIPKLTSRYGFIVGGNEYQVDHLLKLKSGVYTRVQENGEMRSEFNLARRAGGKKGVNFSIKLSPADNRLILEYDKAKIPLYPILRTMGISDEQMEKEWGKEVYLANRPKSAEKYDQGLKKFFAKTSFQGDSVPQTQQDFANYVHKFFEQTAVRPDTTKITLGKSFTQVTGEALNLATTKLLGMARGTHQADDRDSLAFKEVVSIEDFLPQRIAGNSRAINNKMRATVDQTDKGLLGMVPPDLFKKTINDFFTGGSSGVVELSEQTNPVQMITGHRKTTLFSDQGGIKNEHAIKDPMKVINPSHFGFLDPMHTPESERTGVTLNLASHVRKRGTELEAPAFNIKTGKLEHMNVTAFHDATIVLPDQVRWVGGKPVPIAKNVKVKLPGGDIEIRPFTDAHLVLPSAKGMFDYTSNLIPFLPTDQGNRVSMADKQMEQAIPLKHREAPLVQSKTDSKDESHSFEKHVGSFSSTSAPVSGTVVSVGKDSIVISDGKKKHEVSLYNHFPLNGPTGMMHSNAVVKEGDTVKQGQLLADSNFTKGGRLALGSNLRVGYLPYKGYNYEDGIVISQTAAKKLTSEHLHKMQMQVDPDSDKISKLEWQAFNPRSARDLSDEQLGALDKDGIIRVGSKVTTGSVLIAAIAKNPDAGSSLIGSVMGHRARRLTMMKDKSLVWDEDHVGEVIKVVKKPNGKGIKVYVKTEEPMVIGDKLSGRHGNKGIVTQIIPDHEMPFTLDAKTGERTPLEVVLNPSGVPTRINVGQILETAAGKIAEKTGKPFIVNNFAGPNHDYRQHVVDELAKHGLSDEEHVFDPNDPRRPLGSVLVGPQYLMKLKHKVDQKLSVRGGGMSMEGRPLAYDLDHQPVKGGDKGGQGVGSLELYAMLSHNARHNIREMATYKSDQQDESFWNTIQEGGEPPPPKIPFSYKKFEALLKGAGINVQKEGTNIQLLPMTDKDILRMADNGKNQIKDATLSIRSKDLREEKGGIFDLHATGGRSGSKWAYLKMNEPMPNPVFVGGSKLGPVPVLLGLKVSDIDNIMSGTQQLNGKSGGRAIRDALAKIDVNKEIEGLKKELPTLRTKKLDNANRKLKFLLALKDAGLKPHEAYVLNHLPIIPPAFRPMVPTDRGDLNNYPLNQHYKDFDALNQKLLAYGPEFEDEFKNPVRAELWNAFKAMQAVGRYTPSYDTKGGKREFKGIMDIIGGGTGEQPKEGFFQEKLVKRKQNLSIRSTIIPEPNLHIDEVGLPRNAAMELYKPFVVAKLFNDKLFDPMTAQQEIRKGTKAAFDALEEVVKTRPILLKRDPALHKFSVMAFRPRLIEGKAIQIHPLVTGGFNADFDGDTMAGSVPISHEAVEEAKKMFPSKNLFSPTTGGVMYTPSQEALLGLHLLAKWGKKTDKSFATVIEADKAADSGDIDNTDVIHIGGKETTLGRYRIAARLPTSYRGKNDILHNSKFELTKDSLGAMTTTLAKQHESEFAKSIDELKDLGNEHAFKSGFSIGLKDLAPLKGRDKILDAAHAEAEIAKKHITDKTERDKKLIEIYSKATDAIDTLSRVTHAHSDNRLAMMVYSKARGKPEQLRQMIAAPMLMQDAQNRTIPTPVTRSYAEGLDVGDYWLAQHGARKGTLQRAQGTSQPGVMSKEILNTTMSYLITSDDCGTDAGVHMDLDHKDIHDRFLAKPYKLRDGKTVTAGTLLTPEVLDQLKNSKFDKVVVRSPIKCIHGDGICAKCYGLNEAGKLHVIGTNIGTIAGQAMGEPAVQMAMDAFHSGGVAGSGRGAMSISRFEKLRNILNMPKILKNEATLSRMSGKITALESKSGAAGGWDVFIDGQRHFVPSQLALKNHIKVGAEVKKGETLSEGHISPKTLLKHTDMSTVQNFMTNELYHGLYEKEGVRRRNIETVVRALTNLTKITDPGDSHWFHGDMAHRSVVEEHNRKLGKGEKTVHHEPTLVPLNNIPLNDSNENWMARLNFQALSRTLQTAAQRGWKSDIHGSHPIPGIAMGAEFGKPPAGKPKHVY